MHEAFHIFFETLLGSIQVTGLVIVMMLLIEYFKVQSQGNWAAKLRSSGPGQVLLGSILGIIPGCMGGFATVSLYTHGLIGFGGLIAMMIASSGDEAFVMLATIPREALILSAVLFAVAMVSGLAVNLFAGRRKPSAPLCGQEFEMHKADEHHHDASGRCDGSGDCPHASWRNMLHPSWQRIVLLVGVAVFIAALALGMLEHEHEGEEIHEAASVKILDEYWLNLLFALISLFVLWFIATSKEHFIKEHLWHHVIVHHLPRIFCWTAGTMLVINFSLEYLDIASFTRSNVPFMILLAVLVGIIPESGPHLLFVTLFASGAVPFSVLLASSVSQDGHASLPLLAESKRGFLKAKLLNVAIALAAGFAAYAIGV